MSAEQGCDQGQAMTPEALVCSFAPAVLAVCLAHTRSVHDAEDAMQDAMAKAIADIDHVKDPDRARAWVMQIARHMCIDRHRRQKNVQPLPRQVFAPDRNDDPRLAELHIALSKLPEPYREAISIFYLDGRSTAAVAKAMCISETVCAAAIVAGEVAVARPDDGGKPMSNHKRCSDRREAIAELVMGAMAEYEATDIRAHLNACDTCRGLYEGLLRQEQRLQSAFERMAAAACARAIARVSHHEAQFSTEEPSAGQPVPLLRRVQARPRVLKMALAAALVAAVGLVILSRPAARQGGDPFAATAEAAYANVLQQIEKARSVTYTRTVIYEGTNRVITMRQAMLRGGLMRTLPSDGSVLIDDFARGDRLRLSPDRDSAELIHMRSGNPKETLNYPDWIKSLHEREGLYVGQDRLGGRIVDVFKVDQPYAKTTVWTDPTTCLPVRIERILLPCTDKDIRVPMMSISQDDFAPKKPNTSTAEVGPVASHIIQGVGMQLVTTTSIFRDFAWNADLDPDLFSLEVPTDCKVTRKTDTGNSLADAKALAAALQFWAETSNGRFPDNINMLADARPNLVRRYRGTDTPENAFASAEKMMNTILKGMSFAQQCKLEDNWHYDGRNVTLGEADKTVCWWQDKDSGHWQAIYGDMSIKDLPADRPPASQPAEPSVLNPQTQPQ